MVRKGHGRIILRPRRVAVETLMRLVVLCLLSAALLGGAGLATAQVPPGNAAAELQSADADVRRRAVARLAETGTMADAPALVAALRDDDELTRVLAEQALWAVWSRSGDPAVDALFQRGVAQMGSGELLAAIATFSDVSRRKPAFAEGWNKRATVYFLVGDYRRSLADCDEVMKRNPWHFGALAGYGQIYYKLGEPEKALEYFRKALAVNPNMDGVRLNIEGLERVIEGKRGKVI